MGTYFRRLGSDSVFDLDKEGQLFIAARGGPRPTLSSVQGGGISSSRFDSTSLLCPTGLLKCTSLSTF